MKSKEVLLVGVFAFSLLVLTIGVMIGSRSAPTLTHDAVPTGAIPAPQIQAGGGKAAVPPAVLAHQGGAGARLDYQPPAP
jgi:hypothetical protein